MLISPTAALEIIICGLIAIIIIVIVIVCIIYISKYRRKQMRIESLKPLFESRPSVTLQGKTTKINKKQQKSNI